MKKWVIWLSVALFIVIASGCGNDEASGGAKDDKPAKIVLDYAYYSPTSVVLKKFGWAEEAFKEDGIDIEFVLSQGSNKALEFLNSSSVDFGSTAGAAALIAKANGAPIESVYIYSKPEWTALLTTGDAPLSTVEDLKGKKVAAAIGTDPHIFLLRSLSEAGLKASDVEIVNLQHADGGSALTTGQVDAWAGLDPHMAKLELEADTKFLYRNPEFNTYGTLNVRNEFAEKYPDQVKKVIEAYEKARQWVLDNPEEAAKILAEEAQITEQVAEKEMERNDFSNPIPGEDQKTALTAAGEVLQKEGIIKSDNLEELVDGLINPAFSEEVIK
ncbi:aliphatic sulfonate ABC transporter substrate-binding protein [Cytobacillus horneckiae]|uniref:Putative aliphatic sulfonates-binding protein n=1 Tax=Cytobacillus horneckiae TaxID=549687 RepID=A0A2N0ZHI9_9BACI|nr:aliphatic sulfonate ABC transporter substrate-binding protein [Cytobacillus horneckiae]MCM3181196.1 aliphatic sulfonate ABC transporter substrate-binding protein [Cytobacillus horneckiae]MEC1158261.1 aliphatic sulfonate ABC transporter substrate-binding protein [Cytobacillus horneckiae]MED2940095.1 aliphatic sulfonate ABC transporter substrate-binding protein [Cytobacillus horneckiae]PKG28985.1 aliphatic sulfonate ABC transporter substrate-binding protein [Cytobacillus horneckiae]